MGGGGEAEGGVAAAAKELVVAAVEARVVVFTKIRLFYMQNGLCFQIGLYVMNVLSLCY